MTKIVIGKPQCSRSRELLLGSVVDDLIRQSGAMDIHVSPFVALTASKSTFVAATCDSNQKKA